MCLFFLSLAKPVYFRPPPPPPPSINTNPPPPRPRSPDKKARLPPGHQLPAYIVGRRAKAPSTRAATLSLGACNKNVFDTLWGREKLESKTAVNHVFIHFLYIYTFICVLSVRERVSFDTPISLCFFGKRPNVFWHGIIIVLNWCC